MRLVAEKRINILYAVIAVVAAAAAGAWYAGSRIESPADVAARTAPPPPSPILVPVEQRVLSSDIVTRGTVRFGLPQPVSIAPSPLKGAPGLLTTLPVRNTQVQEGDVLITASGRPVFILQGQTPAYRDLVPGLAGEDVRQLKQALSRLGFDPGPVHDPYDAQTSVAVERWYRTKGWEPFGPTRDQLAAVRALEREWGDATKAKAAAAAAMATAAFAVDAARATAAHAMRASSLESAARTDQRKPGEIADPRPVPLAVESERARVGHANAAAEADLAASIAERSLIVLDPRQTETARAAAEARLDVARAARDRIRLEGEMALRNVERDAALVNDRLAVARAGQRSAYLEGERAVRVAQDTQKLAALDLKFATERADQVSAELEAAKQKIGIQVPTDEIVFLRSLPVRVEEVAAAVGGTAAGSVLTVTDNQLAIDSSLTLETAPLVKPGMKVAIDEPALGVKATGVVETVASSPGTRGVDGFHFYIGIKIEPTPVRLEGLSVRLTIPIESTKGAVLAVPVSALSLSTDGTSRLQAEKPGGGLEYITVEPGLSADGYVEVSPVGTTLAPGQNVVVGYSGGTGRSGR